MRIGKTFMPVLIKNATVITQNEKRQILEADILIDGNRIEKIGKNIREKAEETVDARGKIVFPGLVNTHTHVPMTLFRGYGEDMRLHEWLTEKIWPAEAKLRESDIRWGTMLGIAEMVRSGTTAFNEMYVIGMGQIAKAAQEAGIRAAISYSMFDSGKDGNPEGEMRKTREFVSSVRGDLAGGLAVPAVACHSGYTCSPELIKAGKRYAKDNNLLFHIHAAETRKEVFDILKARGKRPIEYLDLLGVLDTRSVLAHCVYVTKREIALAGKAGATVSHSPVSNLKLAGGGISPALEFSAAGANVTLGTDGAASNNSLNMIETMKIAAITQKNHYWDPTAASAQQVLDFATRNGAKALGLDAGIIETGKLADLVIADARAANMVPHHSHLANIVYSMNPSNITDVMINGKWALRDGEITAFDEQKAVDKAGALGLEIPARKAAK